MVRFNRVAWVCVILMGCASADKDRRPGPAAQSATPKSDVSIEAKLAAAQVGSSFVTEITFPKSSSIATSEQLRKIDAAMAQARKYAPVTRATVVAWPDAEMPTIEQKTLDRPHIQLAEQRGDFLRDYLKQEDRALSVSEVNMAKRSGKVNRLLKTESARIQQSFDAADAPRDHSLVDPGLPKASKAIVIFYTKK